MTESTEKTTIDQTAGEGDVKMGENGADKSPATSEPKRMGGIPALVTAQRDEHGKLIVPEGMTKNQYKKFLKEQAWEAGREERQAFRKEKNKEIRYKKREKIRAKRKAEAEAGEVPEKKQKVWEDVTIVLDCGFDEKMIEKEINSLSSQIVRCHSANRSSTHRVNLKLTSFGGRLQTRMETTLQGQHKNWHAFEVTSEPYPVTPQTIYLTAESDDTLEELEQGMTYIVGGIVDKNRHKGICHKKAKEQGLRTAKLPIGEYIEMASRHVLTTNHVVEIMLKWLELKDWKKAFLAVIPQRKLKNDTDGAVGAPGGEKKVGEDGEEEEEEYYDEEEEGDEVEEKPKVEEAASKEEVK